MLIVCAGKNFESTTGEWKNKIFTLLLLFTKKCAIIPINKEKGIELWGI